MAILETYQPRKRGAIIRWYMVANTAGNQVGNYRFRKTVLETAAQHGRSANGQSSLYNFAAMIYFLPGGGSSFAAILTNSASDSACIFRITCPRWIFTVISLVPSSKAICLLSMPETTRPITSRSRAVSDA